MQLGGFISLCGCTLDLVWLAAKNKYREMAKSMVLAKSMSLTKERSDESGGVSSPDK
jgi:hypothetical protein